MRLILARSVTVPLPYYNSRLGTNVKVINSVLMDNVVVAGEYRVVWWWRVSS